MKVRTNNFYRELNEKEGLDARVSVVLTNRELLLLKLCLHLVEQEYAKGSSSMLSDIQTLQDKLPNKSKESE